VIAAKGHQVQVACRAAGVSESGFYAWRVRPPSSRAIRHAWLSDVITQIHLESRGTYGAPRVHAELTIGLGIVVGHNAVAMLMARAGLKGLPGDRRPRRFHETPTAGDLVDRHFARAEPNQLWVTDIIEHRTREGKVYCAVVLDTFSRRVVGWSIDSAPTATLTTNALGMAIENRRPAPGTLIHSDHGTQGGFNWSSQQLESEELRRPVESTQYTSIRYSTRLLDAGALASIGSVGDSFDNALAETVIGLYKTECVRHDGPWRSVDDLELGTLNWVHWFNETRLHSSIGYVPPVEFEAEHYRHINTPQQPLLGEPCLH
jgi:putative transposase